MSNKKADKGKKAKEKLKKNVSAVVKVKAKASLPSPADKSNKKAKAKEKEESDLKKPKAIKKQQQSKAQVATPKPTSLSGKAQQKGLEASELDKSSKEVAPEASEQEVHEKPGKKRGKKAALLAQAASEEEARWIELSERYRNLRPVPYKMSSTYAEKTALDHKVLGVGYILSVVNDRLEVLFKSGIKQLISNYKSGT